MRRATTTAILLVFLLRSINARKARLTWVNGIAYHMDHMEEGEEFISQVFGGEKVRFCYNPTKQLHDEDAYGYLSDLTQAGTQKLGMVTEEVNTLAQFLRESVAKVGRKGVVVHIAHSQGALITALAAKQLTPMEMSQIEVLAFGGAAAIRKTASTPFRRCINYYSVNDPLLLVVPSAAQALRSGLVSDEEFVFLMPRLGDPIADHNLIGPTYAQALEWEGKRFLRSHRSLAYRTLRPPILSFIALLASLAARFDALLKMVLRQMLLRSLAIYARTKRIWNHVQARLDEKLLRPLVLLIKFIMEWILDLRRALMKEEKFVPVSVALMEDSAAKGTGSKD